IGILTNIGDAHQENFVSKEEKTNEKLKLFTSSQNLVFCADDKRIGNLAQSFCTFHKIEPISWSLRKQPSLIQFTSRRKDGFTSLEAIVNNKTYSFEIPFSDASSIDNACHCFA